MTWILLSALLLSVAANIPLAILVNKANRMVQETQKFNQEIIRGLTIPQPVTQNVGEPSEQMEFWDGPDIEQDEWMNSLLTGTPPVHGGWIGEGEEASSRIQETNPPD